MQALLETARRWWLELAEALWRTTRQRPPVTAEPAPAAERKRFLPLERVVLTDGVGHTLFDQYAAHRASARGDEETGWVLLGLREENEAIVLATLPAGAQSDAGVAHVRFNTAAQEVGYRIVRQDERRLAMIGVAHTHPGSLRHPSDGDYRGDSQWVRQLRGREGVFGIGTADGDVRLGPNGPADLARQPRPHMQVLGKLCLSWYALRDGEARYRPLPVTVTLGPDLARALHPVWPILEAHADRLHRIARQQAGVAFDVIAGQRGPALAVTIPLAEPGEGIRVLLEEKEVHYFVVRQDQVMQADLHESRVDQGLYLLLAELAK